MFWKSEIRGKRAHFLGPEEVYQYLLNRGVSSDHLNMLNDEILENAMRQAEANDFTDVQVQQYIEG